MKKIPLTIDLVFLPSGNVDTVASKRVFDKALALFASTHDSISNKIAKSVNQFLSMQDKPVAMPQAIYGVLVDMKVPAENFSRTYDKVHKYMQVNSTGDNALFTVRKGLSGGIFLNRQAKTKTVPVPNKPSTVEKSSKPRTDKRKVGRSKHDEKVLAIIAQHPGISGNAIRAKAGANILDVLKSLRKRKKIRAVAVNPSLNQWYIA